MWQIVTYLLIGLGIGLVSGVLGIGIADTLTSRRSCASGRRCSRSSIVRMRRPWC